MNRDAVVALGNPLMGDEGVGPALLDLLREQTPLPTSVDLIDSAGSILTALHALRGRRKVVFLDCALMGLKPGEFRRFLPSQVKTEKVLPRLSLHEGDLFEMLETAKLLGETAEEIVIFGFEPSEVCPRKGLSGPLTAQLENYISRIVLEFSAP